MAAPAAPASPLPGGILETLSALGQQRHPGSHTVAALGPEEDARVPMLQRGVTLAFLRRIVRELTALGRHDIDAGQFLNGVHTTSSSTDWKEFDRSRDAYRWVCVALRVLLVVTPRDDPTSTTLLSTRTLPPPPAKPRSGKACTLHTGTSVVETMIEAGLTHDPDCGMPYFAVIDTFVRWVEDDMSRHNPRLTPHRVIHPSTSPYRPPTLLASPPQLHLARHGDHAREPRGGRRGVARRTP